MTNMLSDVSAAAWSFLVSTSPLDTLSAELCDDYLGGGRSNMIVRALIQRGTFLAGDVAGTTHRLPELLRAWLHRELRATIGRERTSEAHRRAGDLLAARGATLQALQAYCHAQDWRNVVRLDRTRCFGRGDGLLAKVIGLVSPRRQEKERHGSQSRWPGCWSYVGSSQAQRGSMRGHLPWRTAARR